MKTSSAKAKGRRLQNRVAAELQATGTPHGLEEGDVKPVSMGVSGVDIVLTPAAKKLFDLLVECKNHEKLNVVGVFNEHLEKYAEKLGLKLLVHSRNRSEDLVTMRWADFVKILKASLAGVGFPFTHTSIKAKGDKEANGTDNRKQPEIAVEASTVGATSH
ncbi:MAG: hypothetical protein ACRD2L_08930 [Terriglobia bacterium]